MFHVRLCAPNLPSARQPDGRPTAVRQPFRSEGVIRGKKELFIVFYSSSEHTGVLPSGIVWAFLLSNLFMSRLESSWLVFLLMDAATEI